MELHEEAALWGNSQRIQGNPPNKNLLLIKPKE